MKPCFPVAFPFAILEDIDVILLVVDHFFPPHIRDDHFIMPVLTGIARIEYRLLKNVSALHELSRCQRQLSVHRVLSLKGGLRSLLRFKSHPVRLYQVIVN